MPSLLYIHTIFVFFLINCCRMWTVVAYGVVNLEYSFYSDMHVTAKMAADRLNSQYVLLCEL